MRCLFVKPPFAGYIVDGVKWNEYRTRETYMFGRIGIIESGTGTVIGEANLVACRYNADLQMYEWMLEHPRRFAKPVPFVHRRGAMVWIDLDIDPDKQESAPELSDEEFYAADHAYSKALDAFFAERRKRG